MPVAQPVTVLLTCLGGALTAEVAKAIKAQRELPIRLVGVDCAEGGAGREVVDAFYHVPEGSAPDYVPRLQDICRREEVRVVMPYADEEVEALAEARAAFDALGVSCAVCDVEAVRLLRHKSRLFGALERAGIQVAAYREATTTEALQEAIRALGVPRRPVVVKPCVSRGGRRVWVVARGRLGLEQFLSGFHEDVSLAHPWVAMEYLPGPAYDVDALCAGRKVLSLSIRRRYNPAGIPFMGCVTERNRLIEEKVRAVVASVPMAFCVDVDLAMSEGGEPQIVEINPRMSGSIVGAIRAGVNYPLDIIRMARGLPVKAEICHEGIETLPDSMRRLVSEPSLRHADGL